MNHAHITDESDGTWWTVPKALTKGRNREKAGDLRVPLVGRALETVQRLRLQEGWLFPSVSRAGVVGHQMQTYMQSKVHYMQPYSHSRPDHVRERLTVTHWSPHDLRRTGAPCLRSLGALLMWRKAYSATSCRVYRAYMTAIATTQSAGSGLRFGLID